MIEYFTRPELPKIQFFQCDRLSASISISSCASMWRQANHENIQARARCKLCPIGAVHAGEVDASTSQLKGSLICARCHRPATRLVEGMHCVSCKNREYEWVKGRNAKGSRPTKMAPLAPRCVHYLNGREPCTLRRNLTKNTDELVIAALRHSRNRVSFGFTAAAIGERQGRLFR